MVNTLIIPESGDEFPTPETEQERALRRIRTRARIAFERNALQPDIVVALDALQEIEALCAEVLS